MGLFRPILAVVCALAALAQASISGPITPSTTCPPKTGAAMNDSALLSYGIFMENMKKSFYETFLDAFDAPAFEQQKYPPWVRQRTLQILEHENDYVELLVAELAENSTEPCKYKFDTDATVQSYVEQAVLLEAISSSAWLQMSVMFNSSMLGLLSSATAVGTQAHFSWLNSAVMSNNPWNSPYGTPISATGTYSILSNFVIDCPCTNAALPVTVYPPLTVSNNAPAQNTAISLFFELNSTVSTEEIKMAWVYGSFVIFTPIKGFETTTPNCTMGFTYGAVVTGSSSLAGVSVLTSVVLFEFDYPSNITTICQEWS